ncbi:MAG: ThuA domain-containing protein [Limisphaerales bacterium]
MKKQFGGFLGKWTAVLALCNLVLSVAAASAPKHLLVVTATRGFRHSSIPTAENVLATLGEQSGLFTVDYVRGGADGKGDQDFDKMSPAALKNYDGVIFANTTGDLPIPNKEAFLDWIKSGKAFLAMHSGSDTFHGFPPYIEMLGGEFETHHAQAHIDCVNMDLQHPATRHLGPVYSVFDEIYLFKNFHRDQVHGLLTQDKHPNTGMPGDFPVSWCKRYGEGRVFYTSLGHREDVWTSAAYQQHILGGIEWALGLAPGDATPQSTVAKLSPEEAKEGFKLLFDGVDRNGWHLREPNGHDSWSVQNGLLVNLVETEHGTDLVSDEKFKDFTARFEYLIPAGANSGFYLRGRHEIQIFDDYKTGKPAPGGNGAIYNLKEVSLFASRKPGEWQQGEATMKGNRVTVILNGVKVHDNVEVDRPTGGELDGNVNEPGPILLQGNHGTVAFRNLRIKSLD